MGAKTGADDHFVVCVNLVSHKNLYFWKKKLAETGWLQHREKVFASVLGKLQIKQ
jgi:hypothetical protein